MVTRYHDGVKLALRISRGHNSRKMKLAKERILFI